MLQSPRENVASHDIFHPNQGSRPRRGRSRRRCAANPVVTFLDDPECRHGLGSLRTGPRPLPRAEHAGRIARSGWTADCTGISHRPLGDRAAGPGLPSGYANSVACRSRPTAPTRATAARRGRSACSTVCRTGNAAQVFRRLARSLPTRKGILGVATCDKGLPAMMMALAGLGFA